jgi:hypothetical protein
MRRSGCAALLVGACLACGSSGGSGSSGTDGGATQDSATSGDSSSSSDSSPGGDSGGSSAWDGGFAGPLTCPGKGNYATNWANTCGTLRWSIKTGSDSASTGVSLLPTFSTIASVTSITPPSPFPSGSTPRTAPAETTVYAFKDVNLIFARLEDDSDYHLVMSNGTTTIITEVPYPGCVSGGPWGCLISRARANVEAAIGVSNLQLDSGHNHNLTVSVVGVGFWDEEHGQFDSAPNNVELHPVLAICFGAGCDPAM